MDRHQAKIYRDRVRTLDKIIRDFDKLCAHLVEYEAQASYAVGFMDAYVEKLCKLKSFFDANKDELLKELTRDAKRD